MYTRWNLIQWVTNALLSSILRWAPNHPMLPPPLLYFGLNNMYTDVSINKFILPFSITCNHCVDLPEHTHTLLKFCQSHDMTTISCNPWVIPNHSLKITVTNIIIYYFVRISRTGSCRCPTRRSLEDCTWRRRMLSAYVRNDMILNLSSFLFSSLSFPSLHLSAPLLSSPLLSSPLLMSLLMSLLVSLLLLSLFFFLPCLFSRAPCTQHEHLIMYYTTPITQQNTATSEWVTILQNS